MLGYLPENQIDHKDRVTTNNSWGNLREASPQCQSRNMKVNSLNTSGIKGVCWDINKTKWRVSMKVNMKANHLGYFSDLVEAAAHRFAAEQCVGWSNCDTTSSAGKFLRDNVKVGDFS
jgi:hypothetical protein